MNTKSNRTAGVNVATLFSALANSSARLELFTETINEIDTLKIGPWVKGSPVPAGLGFYKQQGSPASRRTGDTISPVSRRPPTRA